MTYYCDIKKEGEEMYVVRFPDLPNVITYGKSKEHALQMAKEALEGTLEVDLDFMMDIPKPEYSKGYAVVVDPRIAFAAELRHARAGRTQQDVASAIGMTYQQYQRLENPRKTNPTISTIHKLEQALGRSFLAF